MTDRLRDYKNSYQPTVNPANYSNSLSPTLQPHPLRTELSHVQPSALLQSASSSPSSVHLPTTTSSPSIPMSSPYIQHNGSSFSATNTRQLNTAQHHQRLKQQLKFVEQLKLNQLLQKQDQQQQMIRNELTALINDGLQMSPSLQESFFQMNHEQQLQQILEMKATRQLQIQKRKERQLEQQQHHHEARIQHDAANLALNQSKQQHAQSLPSQPQRVESSHTQILWNGVLVWSMNDPVAGTAKEVQSMALMKNVNMLNFPASKPEHW